MTRPERRPERMSEHPWSVPLALGEVSEAGRHLDLVADAPMRAAIAKLAGLAALPRLEASFDVALRGRSGLHVVGCVSATVGQTCVATLDPVDNEIEEPIDIVFGVSPMDHGGGEVEVPLEQDAPEALIDGKIDLGAIATEFLLLGIDPYPRKPGVVFQAPAGGDDSARPFEALAALASEASGQRGESKLRAHSASEDARKRADGTRPEPGSSARAAFKKGRSGREG